MGQRTQMFIVEHFFNENEKPQVSVDGYYCHWGLGILQARDATAYILSNTEKKPEENKNYGNSEYIGDYTHLKPETALFSCVDEWGKFCAYNDNNNGIVVLEIYRNIYGKIVFGSMQCFCGSEDGVQGEPISFYKMTIQNHEYHDEFEVYTAIKGLLRSFNIVEKSESGKITYSIGNNEPKTIYTPIEFHPRQVKRAICAIEGDSGVLTEDTEKFIEEKNIKIDWKNSVFSLDL